MTANETLFEIKLDDDSELGHKPGQFVEVSVFGIGEAPISLSSSPTKKETFELCVRKLGNVTTKLHKLNVGDKIGIRGPFGNGFDVESLKGKDLLFIAGGLGIAPLRSLFNYVLDNRKDYGRVILLYGCKEPKELLFGDELLPWLTERTLNSNQLSTGALKTKLGPATSASSQLLFLKSPLTQKQPCHTLRSTSHVQIRYCRS